MASLWRVDDASTSQLMQRFYCTLANDNTSLTKAEALRKAKMSLLHNTSLDCASSAAYGSVRKIVPWWSKIIDFLLSITRLRQKSEASPSDNIDSLSDNTDFSHPYYWSPFIMIGNGL